MNEHTSLTYMLNTVIFNYISVSNSWCIQVKLDHNIQLN